jgi:hypothetical protein
MKNKILLVFIFSFITGCSGLSGIYQSENGFSVEFISSKECIWYQDGSFFEGTYRKNGDDYLLEIKGSGLNTSTVFNAIVDENDLVITGGIIYKERFAKNNNKKVKIKEHVGNETYNKESQKINKEINKTFNIESQNQNPKKERKIIEEVIKSEQEEKKIIETKEKIKPTGMGLEEAKQHKAKQKVIEDEKIEEMLERQKLKKY